MHTALVLPPLCQLNTPYPSVGYLARTLRDAGHDHSCHDLGIGLVHRVFSAEGLTAVFDALAEADALPEPAWRAMALRDQHIKVVGAVVRFLTGRDRTLAGRILQTPFLPGGPRLDAADLERFGPMGTDDAARYLATLYLEDLAEIPGAAVMDARSVCDFLSSRSGKLPSDRRLVYDGKRNKVQRSE